MLTRMCLQLILVLSFAITMSDILAKRIVHVCENWIWAKQFGYFADLLKRPLSTLFIKNEDIFYIIAWDIPIVSIILFILGVFLLIDLVYLTLIHFMFKGSEDPKVGLKLYLSIKKWNFTWFSISLVFGVGLLLLGFIYFFPELIYYLLITSVGLCSILARNVGLMPIFWYVVTLLLVLFIGTAIFFDKKGPLYDQKN
ncbi:MAG: hypothetical protein HQL29_00030 [Candidatus Omnitrophica bacterium]|nr:hypothetical protein [Candidatus Omnitrophota bacterium]